MESLPLQVDGSIIGRAYIGVGRAGGGGLMTGIFLCLMVDGPITGRLRSGGGGLKPRISGMFEHINHLPIFSLCHEAKHDQQ